MAYWSLYWVESDGLEDCFVVARNSKSACQVECTMNGFESDYVDVTKILRIPKEVEIIYTSKKEYEERPWPWYAYDKFFLNL